LLVASCLKFLWSKKDFASCKYIEIELLIVPLVKQLSQWYNFYIAFGKPVLDLQGCWG
jgi:hypothetical protein